MGAVVSGWRSRLGDTVAERLSRLFNTPTIPSQRFPEAACFALDQPDSLEVFSLDPDDAKNGDPPDRFHGHTIIGRVLVASQMERVRIGQALVAGNSRTRPGMKCFDPYIGVRAVRDGRTVTLAACFWCGNVELAGLDDGQHIFPLSCWPARLLVRQLVAAGVAVAEPPVEA